MLGVLFLNEFYNIAYLTIEDVAKGVQGLSAYSFSLLYPVDRIGRKALLKDKIIFGYTFFI